MKPASVDGADPGPPSPATVEVGAGPVDRAAGGGRPRRGPVAFARRHPTVALGLALIAVMAVAAALAPHLGTVDPIRFSPAQRLRPPSDRFWFGTDSFGRDVYSRTMYGGRISLLIGFSVALLATTVGLAIGLVAGYLRTADAVLMRLMDGLMAIPSILLAIAIIAITRASVRGVLLAIAVPEIPRVVRLVRGIVLTLREQPYVEATRALGSGVPRILARHLLPNTLAPLTVQATYICAVAILIEAALGFLGAGTPPEIPSWGNIMAEGRTNFQVGPWMILFPGTFLAAIVLAVNLVGDGLRDLLDPRFARRL
jgi:peptide/nickel transport system permease protein